MRLWDSKQITNVNEGDGTNYHTRDDLDVAIFRAEGEKDSVNIRIIES